MGVNWEFFAIQFSAWIGTLFVCGFGSAAMFSAVSFWHLDSNFLGGLLGHTLFVCRLAVSRCLATPDARLNTPPPSSHALQGAYAPCIQMGQTIINYENKV